MKCMKCGATLTETDFCNRCGTNVKIYKKLICTSNAYYNRALTKAQVRDLSGAKEDLKSSLKINKKNTQARNLLGLIYFEMGDVVSALTEWIISKNFDDTNNIADTYINEVQKNAGRLDNYNMSLKKFNQSLLYAQQGSRDLAIIQLKKVLSANGNLVSAHLLLGLIYLQQEQADDCRKEMKKVLAIDKGNVMALGYMKEADILRGKDPAKKKSPISSDTIAYTSGNETIIMPKEFKENTNKNVIIDILIGFVIGIAVCWFVFMPARIQSVNTTANKQVIDYSSQLDAKTASIDALNKEVEDAKAAQADAEQKASDSESTIISYESLYAAQAFVNANDFDNAAQELAKVDSELLAESARSVYDTIAESVNAKVVYQLYVKGTDAYNAKNYQEGAEALQQLVDLDPTNKDAIYFLARCYAGINDVENAKKYYAMVLEQLPGTQRAQSAQNYLDANP